MKVIPMHLTAKNALKSHLFGMNAEEPIQVVDLSGSERLEHFKRHLNTYDKEAQQFFTIIADAAKLETDMDSWVRGVQITWRHWLIQWEKYHSELDVELWLINRMNEVWDGPCDDKFGNPLNMSDPCSYMLMLEGSIHRRIIDDTRYSPNMDHPWVQSIVGDMPIFRPTFMFCLCVIDTKRKRILPQSKVEEICQ